MLRVQIRRLSGDRAVLADSVHRGTRDEAVGKAIRKRWGRSAFWWADSGLGPDYGQVCEPQRGTPGANNCLTPRVRIDVTEA